MPLDQEFNEYPYDDPAPAQDEEPAEDGTEMSFLEHLEELRWHIIRAAIAIVVFGLTAFIFIKDIYKGVIIAPSREDFWTYRQMCKLADWTGYADLCVKKLDFKLQALGMADQFTMSITSSVIIGICFAFPYAFWEVWRFIKPGLRPEESRAARGATFYVSMLFLIGLFFGYYIVSPLVINFLANYQLDESIQNQYAIDSYIGTLITLCMGCAIMFQMPIVAFVLSKVGILTPSFMRSYRKHAFIVILVISGLITPSPDIFSQLTVTLPLVLLYEVSIWVSGSIERARLKELARNPVRDNE
ncbi:MAG: twin-arginine translocase subunit TatC [Cytophagales bacterium]|nr:MAG: twin-arginine translocase subunit TatC [Cytophagales bacterium]